MCLPFPGPRCSYHAHIEYVRALQAVPGAKSVEEALLLERNAEAKREAYHATPRGLNDLRVAIGAADGLEQDALKTALARGEALRASQIEALQKVADNGERAFRSLERKGSRYEVATAIATTYLRGRFPDLSFSVEGRDVLKFAPASKVFVAPSRHSSSGWGEVHWDGVKYRGDDAAGQALATLLGSHSPASVVDGVPLPGVGEWFVKALKRDRVKVVAAVNEASEHVSVVDVDTLTDLYSVSVTLQKAAGGTTAYRGTVDELRERLTGSGWAEGVVAQVPGKGFIVHSVPAVPEEAYVGEDLLLSRKASAEGEYFEVRRRHQGNKFRAVVKLRQEPLLFMTGVGEAAASALTASPVTA